MFQHKIRDIYVAREYFAIQHVVYSFTYYVFVHKVKIRQAVRVATRYAPPLSSTRGRPRA